MANAAKTMAGAWLGGLLLFGVAVAVATGGFQDAGHNDGSRLAGTQSNLADINTTQLPDANYATKGLLEARKQGLASESANLADPSKTGTIDPLAVDPYTAADYPDVVRRWGKLIPTVNRERKLAAQIASRDPRCDGVVNAQITDGGTRTDRHYMTECNNLTRIYFDANSLAEHRSALVRTQADMGAQGVLDW
jgi:hypothetical protein